MAKIEPDQLTDQPDKSEEFLVSRTALDEAHSALAGCLEVLGNIANIKHAMNQLKTATGQFGDKYNGH